jgi:hypothetical protein
MYLFQQKRCLRSPKEITHECNFLLLLLLCDGKRARQVLYISIVQSGQEKNEKERAFCVRCFCSLLCVAAPSKKEKRRRKILALFAAGVYNHLSCTSDVSVCVSLIHFLFRRRRRRATEIQNGSMNI